MFLKEIQTFFFTPGKLKKTPSNVAYFSFCSAISILPKSAQSAETVENHKVFSMFPILWHVTCWQK